MSDELPDAGQDGDSLGWWVIHGAELLGALRRAHGGDDPDVVFAELYANATRERP